jgi:hypothetical protein
MNLRPTPRLLGLLGVLLSFSSCVPVDPALMGGLGGGAYNTGGYYREPVFQRPVYGRTVYTDPHDHGRGGYSNRSSDRAYDRSHDAAGHNWEHTHGGDNSRAWGGEREWYNSGYQLGKRDRKAGVSCNYSRHRNHFDGRTRAEFAHGYEDGYRR